MVPGEQLTGSNGMTLYPFDKDTAGSGKSVCNGPCATNLPPLFAMDGDMASGDYSIVIREDGKKQPDPEKMKAFKATHPDNLAQAQYLAISAAEPQKGAACEPINYDPLVMADGVLPTDDPILRFRSSAYAVSFDKRLSER